MTQRFFRGYKPSPIDARDRRVEELFCAAPPPPKESYDLLPYIDFVDNQLSTSSCVWNALQQLHYIVQGVMGLKQREKLSRLFGYYNSRKRSGGQLLDDGTYPRDAWKVVASIGVAREALWPFDPAQVNSLPSWDSYQDGIDQLWLDGYYQVLATGSSRITSIQQAIAAKHPAICAMQIGPEFESYSNGLYQVESEPNGGHMLCIVAYDASGFWLANSWDQDWGTVPLALANKFKGGFAHISWSVALHNDIMSDIWIGTHTVEFAQ